VDADWGYSDVDCDYLKSVIVVGPARGVENGHTSGPSEGGGSGGPLGGDEGPVAGAGGGGDGEPRGEDRGPAHQGAAIGRGAVPAGSRGGDGPVHGGLVRDGMGGGVDTTRDAFRATMVVPSLTYASHHDTQDSFRIF